MEVISMGDLGPSMSDFGASDPMVSLALLALGFVLIVGLLVLAAIKIVKSIVRREISHSRATQPSAIGDTGDIY